MGVVLGLVLLFSIAVGAWELCHAICDPLRDHIHARRKLHNQRREARNQLLSQRGKIEQTRHKEKLQFDLRERHSKLATERRERQLQGLFRKAQLGLHDVPTAPDFQRTTAILKKCASLPPTVRRGLYLRFKRVLVDQYRRRLQAGTSDKDLHKSLKGLLQQLGIAGFEADYIRDYLRAEASRKQKPAQRRTINQEMQEEQLRHQQRVAAINNTARSEHVQEELLEIEQQRHDEAMRRITGGSPPTDPNVVEI